MPHDVEVAINTPLLERYRDRIAGAGSETKCNRCCMKKCCMAKKVAHLTLDDRTLIQTQFQQGLKPAAIAASLGDRAPGAAEKLANAIFATSPLYAMLFDLQALDVVRIIEERE